MPLGIQRQRSPDFDPSRFKERQRLEDEEREAVQTQKVEEEPLDSPDVHQDYEIKDGDEYDRHLEGISSVNALKELIQQAVEELEEELEITVKPFKEERMNELMVFGKEAIIGYGEATGYAELKRRIHAIILADVREAMMELDRKKEAYMRASGK